MKIISKTFIIIVLFFLVACKQPKINHTDKIFIQKAINLAETSLGNEIKEQKHIIFAMGNDSQLVLVDNINSFKEYFIHISLGKVKISSTEYNKPNDFYNAMFNDKQYHNGVITFESSLYKEGYETAQGNKTYFVLRDKKKKYGESVLSVFIKPNPIPPEIYNYFITKILDNTRLKE